MTKTFLRSGSLDAVLALGENGQPVFASARQLRETLRLRKQHALADCLAIPQINDAGDRLDWYAPFSGRLKSWRSASDSERRHAIQLLESHQLSVNALSQQALQAEKPAMKLFGALLSKAFQFPDCQYVYLVDGKPVITFWGFVELDKKARQDALDCLRDTLDEAPPLLVQPAEAPPVIVVPPVVMVTEAVAEPAVITPEAEPEMVAPAPVIAAPVSQPRRRLPIWWLLPPLAIAVAGAVVFLTPSQQPPVASAPVASAPVASDPTPARAPAILLSAQKLAQTLPLLPASVASVAPAAAAAPAAANAARPAAKDDLVITADTMRIGSTRFLDGRWRVTLSNATQSTGKPVTLRYTLRRGKGSASVVQSDGLRCQADEITAGWTSTGDLAINSRFTAKCSDGSRYRMPQLVCKQGDGAAQCEAQFGETASPMTIKRESK